MPAMLRRISSMRFWKSNKQLINMNSKPKISVIVPVYKAEKYLHKCVVG